MTMAKGGGQKNIVETRRWVFEQMVSAVNSIMVKAFALSEIYAPNVIETLRKDCTIDPVSLCDLDKSNSFKELVKPKLKSVEKSTPNTDEISTDEGESQEKKEEKYKESARSVILDILRTAGDFVGCMALYKEMSELTFEKPEIRTEIVALLNERVIEQTGTKRGAKYRLIK